MLRLSSDVTSEGYLSRNPSTNRWTNTNASTPYVAATRAARSQSSAHRTESTRPPGVGHGRTRYRCPVSTPFVPTIASRPAPTAARTGGDSRSRHLAGRTRRRLERASARTVVAATTLFEEAAEAADPDLDKRREIWICRRGRRAATARRSGGRCTVCSRSSGSPTVPA